MKKILFFAVIALLGISFAACSDDHEGQVPEIAKAPNTLSGIVTDAQGNPIVGATVRLAENEEAFTGGDGVYNFDNVAPGTYNVEFSAPGKFTTRKQIVMDDDKENSIHLMLNAVLSTKVSKQVNVTVDEGGEGEVESEAIQGNDEGKVEITVEVPADAAPEDTEIYLTPIYTEESAEVTRAGEEDTMLIGATLSCSDENVKLNKDIAIKFALDQSVVNNVETKKFVNGKWVAVANAIVDGDVVISDREFTSYGIFLKVSVRTTTATEALKFAQSEWNNLYGGESIYVDEASFTYKVGTEITSKAVNKLEGLLIEHLARLYGASVKTVDGKYPINTTFPVGTALFVKGAQEKVMITVTSGDKSVKGVNYGALNIQTETRTRQHNGGGSK